MRNIKIGELCLQKESLKWDSKNSDFEYLYIDLSSVDREFRSITEPLVINRANAPSRAKQIVHTGDILFGTTRPMQKRSCIIIDKYDGQVCSTGFCLIRPNHDLVYSNYMHYCICSQRFYNYIEPLQKGISYPAVSDKDIYNYCIDELPPLEVQCDIARELDSLQLIIDEYKFQLEDLNKLGISIFFETFGDPILNEKKWDTCKLKDVTTLITNGNTPKGGEKVYVKEGILFLRSQNVWRNEIKLEDVAFIDEETNASMRNSMLHHNDILITKTGRINTENSSLGRASIYTGEDGNANINGHVYLVRLKDNINPTYYLYALISDSFRELIRNVCVGAIDKRQLNRTHIEEFPVMLAPLALQEKFASQIKAIDKQKTLLREQLADAEQLMAERMQYYFS